MADFPHQLRLDLGAGNGKLSPLVAVQEAPLPPDQVKRLVDRLRGQMRALGAINPNAVAEYEETRQRHTFLSTQADDLQQASKSLRAVVGELDAIMKKRFSETFKAVAEEFKRFFGLLFNGGTARLMLTDPDDPAMTGIDIVAQPPGRRMQSLALLSGGERALTATALLFAILAVNPTPFCVLDEVDAALDEANVGRFTPDAAHPVRAHPVRGHHPQPGDHGGGQRALRRLHGRGRDVAGHLAQAGGGAGARREIAVRVHRFHDTQIRGRGGRIHR